MSNQQWPSPGGPPGNNPWAQQDPNWRPTQFHDAQGRDPRQPFGQPSSVPPPSLDDLAPPKKPNSTVFIVVGIVGLIAAVLLGMQFLGGDPDDPPVATSSQSAAPDPTATRTGNFIPFEGNGDGIFEIVRYEWVGDELRLRIRVEVERGEYGFAVFAYANATREPYDPIDRSSFIVSEGEPVERDVTFIMPNADSTIILTTPSGRVVLNALPVKGSS